ncbi:MAG: Maf family nucleotide pyrophosphatase [Bacteroidia bacterium]|nr:Maf family nucleotide pyrophosphatase [Bacteroidia bacterium]
MHLNSLFSRIILASGSPRRKELLRMLECEFEVLKSDCDESYPVELKAGEIAEYLANKKSLSFNVPLKAKELLITADTIVWLHEKMLGKPQNTEEAVEMIKKLSGNVHSVFTGVALRTMEKLHVFYEETRVYFNPIDEADIIHYVEKYRPFDKAGAYGVQEWIGAVGIRKIDGCYYNVMGLPTARLYEEIKKNFT